jgi:hypothetical protein
MSWRRWAIPAGAAVLVTAAAGLGVWLGPGRGTEATPGPPPAAAPARAESACGLEGSADTEGAKAATWQDIGGGWRLPVSATDGPGVRDPHGPWSCYARTQSGAIVAGYVIGMRAELADDWQAVVRAQTMPGAGQTAKLAGQPASAPQPVSMRGFRVVAYNDTHATVGYYLHTPSLEAGCTANLIWSNGDWRVQLQEDGSSLSGCTPGVPSSFTPWGPAE